MASLHAEALAEHAENCVSGREETEKTRLAADSPFACCKNQEPHEKNQDSETMMDETDNENEDEDEDEGEEEEGENDDKEKDDGEKEVRSKPAACTPDTSFADTQVDELQNDTCAQPVGYHLHLLRAASSAERVTQPASDSQALANANADAYDVKFIT